MPNEQHVHVSSIQEAVEVLSCHIRSLDMLAFRAFTNDQPKFGEHCCQQRNGRLNELAQLTEQDTDIVYRALHTTH